MKYNFIIGMTLSIISGLIIFSCDKEDKNPNQTQPTTYQYPLKIGNKWNYHRTVILEYFNASDSTTIIDRDTIESDYLIQNENIEILKDSIEAYQMKSTNLTSGINSYEYCNNNSQGLFCYAYKINDGAEPFAKKIYKNKMEYCINNLNISNINTLINNKSDSLIYDNPPAKIISYPIIYNTKWTLRTNQMTIYKEIIGSEYIKVNQANIYCYKIKYSYSENMNGNIDYNDYVSSIGLVKRTIFMNNVIILDEFSQPIDKRCNFKEETKLINYMLN